MRHDTREVGRRVSDDLTFLPPLLTSCNSLLPRCGGSVDAKPNSPKRPHLLAMVRTASGRRYVQILDPACRLRARHERNRATPTSFASTDDITARCCV